MAREFVTGQDRIMRVYDTLNNRLRELTGAAGHDEMATKFAENYPEAVKSVYDGMVKLHGVLGGIAQGLAEAGENHRKADADSAGDDAGGPPPLWPTSCPAAAPPPSITGEGDVGLLGDLADFINPYPSADLNSVDDIAKAFGAASSELGALAADLHNHLRSLANNNVTEDLDALERFWRRVDGGDETLFGALRKACGDLGSACSSYWSQVYDTREEIDWILGELVLELAVTGIVTVVADLYTAGGATSVGAAGGRAILSSATSRIAVKVAEAARLLAQAGAVVAVGHTAGAMTAAMSHTPEPNISKTEANKVGEEVGTETVTGGKRLTDLDEDTQKLVDETIKRASEGKSSFPKQDGKIFNNLDKSTNTHPLPQKEHGYYQLWTAARPGTPRGAHRIIIGGDPAKPDVIYYWDHVGRYTQVYP